MSIMNQLQKSLLVNALFSGISGIVLVAINRPIANLFGISNTSVFWIIGVALVSFSVTIIYQMQSYHGLRQKRPVKIMMVILL